MLNKAGGGPRRLSVEVMWAGSKRYGLKGGGTEMQVVIESPGAL